MSAERLFYEALDQVWESLSDHLKDGLNDTLSGSYRKELIDGRHNGYLSGEALTILESHRTLLSLYEDLPTVQRELASLEPFNQWTPQIDFPLGLISRGLGNAIVDLAFDGILRTGNIKRAREIRTALFKEAVETIGQTDTRFLMITKVEGLTFDTNVSLTLEGATLRKLTIHEANRLGYLSSRLEPWRPQEVRHAPHVIFEFMVPRDRKSTPKKQYDADKEHLTRVRRLTQAIVALAIGCDHNLRFHRARIIADFPLDDMNSTVHFQPLPLHKAPHKVWDQAHEGQVKLIAQMLAQFCARHESRMVTPLRRYVTALCADDPRDGIVDGVIALESLLFLGEGPESETTHKFSVRLAWLVGGSSSERLALLHEATGLYRTRSKIVHGSEHSLDKEQWSELDEKRRRVGALFRAVLRRLLDVPCKSEKEWSEYWKSLIMGS